MRKLTLLGSWLVKWALGGAVLAGWLTCAAAPPPHSQPGKAPPRPNIVVVMTDDMDAKLLAFMPKTNQLLVDKGTTFTLHQVTLAGCCPSRATILRGQFTHNTGIYTNSPPYGGYEVFHSLGHESSTIATWLQDAGYRTAMFGKHLNGYPLGVPHNYIPPGWTRWASATEGRPYTNYNYVLNVDGVDVHYGSSPADYLTDVLTRFSVDFINDHVATHASQPFFLMVNPRAPHWPATPAERHKDLFPGAQVPRTASYDEVDVSDKPTWVRNLPRITPELAASMDDLYRKRLQSLQAVDDMVEALITTLKRNGVLGRTFVFFTSDHGFHMGEHRLPADKFTAYEEDLLTPLVVRGPQVPAQEQKSYLTSNVDLAPTWADLAGVTPPTWVDGRSLRALFDKHAPVVWRQALLLEHGGEQPDMRGPVAASIKSTLEEVNPPRTNGKHVGASELFNGLSTPGGHRFLLYSSGEVEFYDMPTDPLQLNSLGATVDPALVSDYTAWLATLTSASGAQLRAAEENPPTAARDRARAAREATRPAASGR